MYFPAGAGIGFGALEDFSKSVHRAFGTLGINVPRDTPAMLKGNQQAEMVTLVGELLAKVKDRFNMRPDLLLFLLHGASERLYKAIKNICEIHYGIASQG